MEVHVSQTKDDELITERRKVYGDPETGFIRIAQVWSGIIGHEIRPVEVPLMMAGMKLVRTQVCPDYSDNSDDITGYMDIFRLLVGEGIVEARSVIEYLEKKHLPDALLNAYAEKDAAHAALCEMQHCHVPGKGHSYEQCPAYRHTDG